MLLQLLQQAEEHMVGKATEVDMSTVTPPLPYVPLARSHASWR
jgi:hypothetical protein